MLRLDFVVIQLFTFGSRTLKLEILIELLKSFLPKMTNRDEKMAAVMGLKENVSPLVQVERLDIGDQDVQLAEPANENVHNLRKSEIKELKTSLKKTSQAKSGVYFPNPKRS